MAKGTSSHLAVHEHRDGAFVAGLVRIMMNQFVQRGASRHRIKEQNHSHQHEGDECLAEPG